MEYQKSSISRIYFYILIFTLCVLISPAYTDECLPCHKTEADSFALTKHAADKGCDICHGDTQKHLSGDNKKDNMANPKNFSAKKADAICTACHHDKDKGIGERFKVAASLHDELRCYDCHVVHLKEGQDADLFKESLAVDCAVCHEEKTNDFYSSEHGVAKLECRDCHKLHTVRTISKDIEEELDNCVSCHPTQELEFKYAYPHPLRERQIKCSDCHNPHSDRFEAMLIKEGDEACSDCHADIMIESGRHPASKGTNHPFKTVKCMDCHRPHGSIFPKVLKYNSSSICKTCHN